MMMTMGKKRITEEEEADVDSYFIDNVDDEEENNEEH
jgi:hypothetical protein